MVETNVEKHMGVFWNGTWYNNIKEAWETMWWTCWGFRQDMLYARFSNILHRKTLSMALINFYNL